MTTKATPRIRRLVERSTGFFYRCPTKEQILFAGKTREEADRFVASKQKQVVEVAKQQRVVGERAPYRDCYDRTVSRAQKHSHRFASVLTLAEFDFIVVRAAGRCEVTGISFNWDRPKGQRKNPWGPSLDRIDCSLGYEVANCRLVCVAVNMALNEFGEGVLIKISKSLLKRQRELSVTR